MRQRVLLGTVVGALAAFSVMSATARPALADDEPEPAARKRVRAPRYREDEPIPPGYHVEEKPKTALIVAGAVISGFGSIFVAVGLGEAASRGNWGNSADAVGVAVGGVFVAAGLPFLILGLVGKRHVLVRNDASTPRWFAAPFVSGRMGGAAIGATF